MDLSDFPSLEQLIPLMPGHVYLLDRQGIYRGCNDLQAQNVGLQNRAEIIGKTNKLLPAYQQNPSLIDIIDSNNSKVIEAGKALEFEEKAILPNSQLRTFKSYKIPVFNKNKDVIGLLGMSFDISETKSEFAELQDKHDQTELALDNIMSNLPGHIYWVDKNNCFLGCNDEQAHDFGLKSRAEITGLSVASFQTPENAKNIIKNNEQVILHGKTIEEEENFVNRAGKEQIYLSKKVPLKNNKGEILGLLGISFDVTELKKAQDNEKLALQKSAADEATKRALLVFSGMSTHDLRTPLSSINLRAAFLKKYLPALTDSYKMAVEANCDVPHLREAVLSDLQQAPLDILQGVREANEYIDSSLKSLKSASQGDELIDKTQLVDCNIERLLRRIVDNYPYKENQQQLLHWNNEHDFNFHGNIIFFNRLIENLIKNAFEQIELKGRGEIFIHCSENNQFNTLSIKDTAGGVTQAIIDKMFNCIQSTKQGGTGIGLTSAKQIMQGMNGDIECHLVDGDYIEFVLSFPRKAL